MTVKDQILDELHKRIGICGHCGKKCCEFHLPNLEAFIKDYNITEADYQTWYML